MAAPIAVSQDENGAKQYYFENSGRYFDTYDEALKAYNSPLRGRAAGQAAVRAANPTQSFDWSQTQNPTITDKATGSIISQGTNPSGDAWWDKIGATLPYVGAALITGGAAAAGAGGAGAGAGAAAEGATAIAPWGAGEAVSGTYGAEAGVGAGAGLDAGMDWGMYNPNQANPYVTGASGPGATAATNAAAGGGAVPGAATVGTAATTAGTTALSRILSGSGTSDDYLQLAGQVGPSLLSAYGSKVQADKYGDLAGRYEGYGAPYRQNLADITNDPSKFYDSPAATKATDAILRRLSISGNPAGNPYSQALGIDALYKEYGTERDRQAGYGGLTAYNQATPGLAAGAIGAQGAVYSDLGYGLGNVIAPKKTLAQQLAEYKAAGGMI